ncbi:MAG TPA: hypothetical protein VMP01_05295 [Pirellulaceae bacterium]|nr:hypothetical protein [Pirellulaceae bacterium]
MSHSITIQLPDNVYEPLAERAQQTGQSVEALAENAIASAVSSASSPSLVEPTRDWIGAWASHVPDAGERHDEYLGQALFDELSEPRHE